MHPINHIRTLDTILFYPELPNRHYTISRIISTGGWWLSNKVKDKFCLIIHWNDNTFKHPGKVLQNFHNKKNYKIINYGCINISKRKIGIIFNKTFGYPILVNPFKHKGKAIRKSVWNASHDGKVIECPIEKDSHGVKKEKIFQKYVDAQEKEYFINIRVPIFGDNIPFVYLFYRKMKDRFNNKLVKVELINDTNSIFSNEEIKNTIDFCQGIGLDYGELDVLRDKKNGKLYIVDANDTPTGPPGHLDTEQFDYAINKLTISFEKMYNAFKIPITKKPTTTSEPETSEPPEIED